MPRAVRELPPSAHGRYGGSGPLAASAGYCCAYMDCKDFVIEGLGRVEESLRMTLEGLNGGQLAWRPAEHANSIAWLAWHLSRVEDDHVSDLAGTLQAW